MKESFSKAEWAEKDTTNKIIEEEIGYWKQFGSGIYPAVVVNNRTYRGQLESLAVFNALCAGFAHPPSMCTATLGSYSPDFLPPSNGIKGGVIVAIVICLIALNILVVYCYRRYTKREIQHDMQQQIESAVSQYFAMSQVSSGKI